MSKAPSSPFRRQPKRDREAPRQQLATSAAAVINARASARVQSGHPWVYQSDVLRMPNAEPGSLVRVDDHRGKMLGTALFSSTSQITLRLISPTAVDPEQFPQLLRYRIRQAIEYRRREARDTDAFRVIFSEGDQLPGLIVDKYNEILSFQVLTQAMDAPFVREVLVEELREAYQPASIVERVEPRIRELESLPAREDQIVFSAESEPRAATTFHMNGLSFRYDGSAGQKTGAFLDQRENYAAAQRHARGRGLDICTYQGGFALHINRACDHVTAVDVSRAALETAEQNANANGGNEIEFIEADAFDLLRDYADAGEKFDTIVLDPPAFAKSRKNAETALRGYKELNLRALKMLRSGGVLVTCSCSFHVGEGDFLEMLASAAQDAHRSLRVTEKRTQSVDHPILLTVPETYYLKCVICTVV